MNLVSCRYNPKHKMKCSRLLIHEDQCPDRFSKILKSCPYNPVHKLSPENYEKHKQSCPQRPQIDEELKKQIKDYINSGGPNRENFNEEANLGSKQSNLKTNFSDNKNANSYSFSANKSTPNNISNTVGIRQIESNKSQKKEKTNKQKEFINLIEKADFEEGVYDKNNMNSSDFNFRSDNINYYDDNNFDENINAEAIDEIYDNMFISTKGKMNNEIKQEFDPFSDNRLNDEYDPNACDLLIDKKNKNNFDPMIYKNKYRPKEDDSSFSIITTNSVIKDEDDY